ARRRRARRPPRAGRARRRLPPADRRGLREPDPARDVARPADRVAHDRDRDPLRPRRPRDRRAPPPRARGAAGTRPGGRGRRVAPPRRAVRRAAEGREMTKLVDLSMPVHADMLTFPRVPAPALLLYESWTDFAERIGAAQYGAKSLTASYLVIQNDHVGTHVDAVKHIRGPEAPGVEGIPLDYCFSDGVRLDFRHKEKGSRIFPDEIDDALAKIGYERKERDIVLIHT